MVEMGARVSMSDRTGARSVETPGPVASYAWSCRQRLRTASKRAVASVMTPRC